MSGEGTTIRLAFDRGTIRVEGIESEAEAARLPGVVWDPRVGGWRAPGWRYGEIIDAAGSAGVCLIDDVANREGVRGAGDGTVAAGWRQVGLRAYQEAAIEAWEMAGRRGVVVLPTGSGKTRVALGAMARAGVAALCLVPTRVLLHQWRQEIAKVYGGRVGCLGDGECEVAPVTVATFESAWRQMDRIGGRFDLLVVDEVHHFGNGIRDEAIEMAVARARLGLTATPLRAGAGAERVSDLVGPVAYELAIGDLAGLFLAPFDRVVLHLDLDPEERRSYERDMATFREVRMRFSEANGADFARLAMRLPEGREAIAAWRRARRLLHFTRAKVAVLRSLLARHRASRVLVFTAANDSAYEIARRHLIMPLTCDIGRKEREEVLDRFRRGELRALVSARVLNEGLDVPDADTAIVVGGTQGEREHVQRIGRLLRPAPGKRALVYELVTRGTVEAREAQRRRRGLGSRVAASL